GTPVRVHMLGDAAPLPGEARLLGTSSAFVYLWWPAQQRAEAVPITSVRQVQGLRKSARNAKAPQPAPSASPTAR
ncbi:MAG: hypothetical protein J0H45_05955, partial [Stenotrophomonas nitritireducens]|nr:hypothetical protein [Stenotrophomonas nitritireducens]